MANNSPQRVDHAASIKRLLNGMESLDELLGIRQLEVRGRIDRGVDHGDARHGARRSTHTAQQKL